MTTDTLTAEEKLDMLRAAYARGEVRTLLPLLPLLKVDGRPMVQTNHYQFEPVYKIDMPRSTMLMCARQCGKSVSIVTEQTSYFGADRDLSFEDKMRIVGDFKNTSDDKNKFLSGFRADKGKKQNNTF